MTVVFRPAIRQSSRLLIGLAGGTGSGKTYSALLLATGLTGRDGKIAMIDTEQGRSQVYAPAEGEAPDFKSTFSFVSAYLHPPFTPERYEEHIVAGAEFVGEGGVVIIDSMSHEWEGPGGLLEQANTIAMDLSAKHNKSPDIYAFPSWREPKRQHQKLVNKLLQLPCHLVLCFRAKEKMKMVPGRQPVSIGLQPIMEDGLPYEMSIFAMLKASAPGVPEFTLKAIALPFPKIIKQIGTKPIDESFGRSLRDYAQGRADKLSDAMKSVVLAQAKDAFKEGGMEGLKTHVSALGNDESTYLRSIWKEVVAKDEPTMEREQNPNVE